MGDAAGFLNVPRIKGDSYGNEVGDVGSRSGMGGVGGKWHGSGVCKEPAYTALFQQSWLYQELHAA